MSTKLIQTKYYLLLVEKIYGFKVGDWNYEEDNTIPVYQFDYNIDEYPGNKIIAYYPLTKEAKELDLPLLPLVGLETEEEFIQSLSTQQLPIDFIPDTSTNGKIPNYPEQRFKTIVNSQGQKIVQGEYKFK